MPASAAATSVVKEATLHDKQQGFIYVDKRQMLVPEVKGWVDEERRRFPRSQVKVIDLTELLALRDSLTLEGDESTDGGNDLHRHRVRDLICRAAEHKASDIRIRVRAEDTVVSFVIDDEERIAESMSAEEGHRVLKAIYVWLARGDSQYYEDRDQAANVSGEKFPRSTGLSSLRIQKGPAYPLEKGGEFMVIRLQYTQTGGESKSTEVLPHPKRPEGEFQLPKMGYQPIQIRKVKHFMDVASGIILVTGPTGSGKTTTLAQILQEMQRRTPERAILTVEDPVEYEIPGATQLQIVNALTSEERSSAYKEKTAVLMRSNPKVILLGEIRDSGVAQAALDAALTGHVVFSTLHVNDPFQWAERFEEMGLNRRSFCDSYRVRGVISQRLLPKLCPKCSWRAVDHPDRMRGDRGEEFTEMIEVLETWGGISDVRFRGDGCEACIGKGTIGRFAVAEVIVIEGKTGSELMKRLATNTEDARLWYYGNVDADKRLIEQGVDLIRAGQVDPFAVKRRIDAIPPRAESNEHGVAQFSRLRQVGVAG